MNQKNNSVCHKHFVFFLYFIGNLTTVGKTGHGMAGRVPLKFQKRRIDVHNE